MMDQHGRACIGDFGLSILVTAENKECLHINNGPVRFSAPELLRADQCVFDNPRPTFQSDIYAFACIAIEVRHSEP